MANISVEHEALASTVLGILSQSKGAVCSRQLRAHAADKLGWEMVEAKTKFFPCMDELVSVKLIALSGGLHGASFIYTPQEHALWLAEREKKRALAAAAPA